jgi:hypothetical protein
MPIHFEDLDDDQMCSGCGCDPMPYSSLNPADDCLLTPGDESPAGRCPDCDCLVYPIEVEQGQRLERAAPAMLAALEIAAELIDEAMSVHIYDADQGEAPEPDCGYAAGLRTIRAAIAAAKGA